MNDQEKLNALKNDLNIELSKDIIDSSKIIKLSGEIADLDKSKVRFSIDSGVIDRLGKELVARQETAVSELVKNSYDADATLVELRFIETNDIGGVLRIKDNGTGMSRDELINGFMRISSTNKIHNQFSKLFNRKRAGQKGIGRFAVQRLGTKLTIITQTEDSDICLQLTIDWNKYLADSDLNSIYNLLEELPSKDKCGTELIISDLRDKWSEASIKRIYRYVSDIIQPYTLKPIIENAQIKETSEYHDEYSENIFSTKFYKIDNGIRKTIADNQKMIYDYAVAEIDGYINSEGKGIFNIISKKLSIDEIGEISSDPDIAGVSFKFIKNLNFKAYYFIYDSDLVPATQSTLIKKLAATQGGIRLYRNGFRVLPYGEPSNDWLKLDKSARQRSILPAHSNVNFFGFVQLIDHENYFYETSSREGLTENEALIEMQNFVYRTLITGVLKVAERRNIKVTSGQIKDQKGNWEKIDLRIKNISHTLEELDQALENETNSIEVKKRRKRKLDALKKSISEIEKLQKEEQAEFLKEKSMLRVLSSVGLTIAQFIHEIKYYTDNIKSDIDFLIRKLDNDHVALTRLTILDKNFTTFNNYTSYFDNVVSQNLIRELVPLDLRIITKDFINSLESSLLDNKISIFEEPIFRKYRLFTKPMHPSEWSSILFNLYTNSIKAIKRAGVKGKILIECGEVENLVYLEFSDNGDGISAEIEERIFDEFFTTTSSVNFESFAPSNEISGTGLGLKIVKDTVKSYRGNIFVASPKEDYCTTIRIEIPKATEKELEKYGI
ncbi:MULTISPECIES: sensor histidine kinase [unclassified Chryseobacterium]|uniref:sensor histidine kinase n=1 Tax=unclassified Chryseobacterium TaxID=2593645 RepID=UPI000D3CD8D6|nr:MULTISPECIES: sensor histidine kinase [unclassified Chryseobacterium]PTT72802.1 ATP-binding protein [Chryseobacterium sp. HMWF001]PVV50396.1 ATP-binding protein [Chryseobacterium sp. HMWF035]